MILHDLRGARGQCRSASPPGAGVYWKLTDAYLAARAAPLADELERTVNQIEAHAAAGVPPEVPNQAKVKRPQAR